MVKIKFTADYKVNAVGGAKYKAGEVASMPTSSARHFVSRGVAEYWTGKKKPKPKPKPSGENRRIKADYANQPDVPEPDRAAIAKRTFPDG